VPVGELDATTVPSFAELFIRTNQRQAVSRGICGLLSAQAFLDGTVQPHEKTLLARLQRQEATVLVDGGALGKPVLLTVPSLRTFWEAADRSHACDENRTVFNGQNNEYVLRPYRLTDKQETDALELQFTGPLVIADGHHRAETHAQLSRRGEQSCDFIPVCIIGGDELTIGAFTRVISDDRSPAALLPELGHFFEHQRLAGPEAPTKAGEWLLVCQDACYRLSRKPDGDKSIDSEWLDRTVLPRVFSINDTRSDSHISFAPTPDEENGLLSFPHESGKVYLCGFPLPVNSFFEEVKAGHCLPPKSTRFEPRVPSGLLVWKP
jgi:uncharacterized protein (DUF1015 family)